MIGDAMQVSDGILDQGGKNIATKVVGQNIGYYKGSTH